MAKAPPELVSEHGQVTPTKKPASKPAAGTTAKSSLTGNDFDPAVTAALAGGSDNFTTTPTSTGGGIGPGTPPDQNPNNPVDTKATDWADTFWGNLGLPPDVISGLNQALSGVTDSSQAQALGQQYLMKTPWFQQTFPGYDSGLTAGLFSDPSGYRQYVNELNVMSQQYNGTPISAADVEGYLKQGFNTAYVANLYQGKAYIQANSPEIQYEAGNFGGGQLNQAQLTALGNEKGGIDTALGQKLQNQVQLALGRMQKAFSGTAATPSLSLGSQGLNSPSTLGQKTAPDVAA